MIEQLILGGIIVILLVERFFYSKEMNTRLSEAMKAVMSRNINEFLTATKPYDKKPFITSEPEEINLAEASPEEFDKFIKSQVS